MYRIIKRILFFFPPEYIHYRVMGIMKLISGIAVGRKLLKTNFHVNNKSGVHLFGLHFPNPVGLAAGFDKNAKYIDEMALLGFGFIEIGTVTPLPQKGNPKPRLFRLPQDKALINRMGFNNEGAEAVAQRLSKRKTNIIIGGNIGKNKITSNEEAISDYEKCFEDLFEVVDYFVVNVSSPNTPDLRALQEKEPLKQLLERLQEINNMHVQPKPLLLKIAPDLNNQQLDDIIDIVSELKLSGIVATNTTIHREGLLTSAEKLHSINAGGLSGRPLKERSTQVVKYIYQKTSGAIPIIASGGIFTSADAMEKLAAGASLVQVYTGFIYKGPAIVKNICKGLAAG